MPCVLLSTKIHSHVVVAALGAAVGALVVAWGTYGSTTPIVCASLLLVTTAFCLARALSKNVTTHADSDLDLAVIARGVRTDHICLGESDIHRDPFHAKVAHVPRRAVVTRAAHSTGRHEASYVVAVPCFVGVREAIAAALGNVWPQPDLMLLAPAGHLVYCHNGEIDTTIPALAQPLATGDSVTVRLDADTGRVLFVVNGNRVGPSMPLAVGGAYAFVATDPATASTISMIADRG